MFHYRRRLPGRARGEVAVSLRTRRFREAEHLAGVLDEGFADAWNRAVSEAAKGGDLNASLRQLLNAMIAADHTRRAYATGQPFFTSEDLAFFRRARQYARQCIATGRGAELVEGAADMLARRHGLDDAGGRRLAEIGAWEAFIAAAERIEAQVLGQRPIVFTEQEPPPPPAAITVAVSAQPAAAVPALPEAPRPLMSALERDYFKHRATVADATEQVMNQDRGTLRRFREERGDRPVDSYGRGDATGFLGRLRLLPTNYGKSPTDKDRALADIIAEADSEGAPRLKDKTVKRHLSALSQFFKWCFDQGHITEAEWKNLVGHHAFRDERAARDQREAWAGAELAALFGSPVWKGCDAFFRSQDGPHVIRDWRFWLPLLAMFQGARLEEFADLRRRDLGCDGGTWFFRIREGEDRRAGRRDQDGRRAQARRLKNTAATRVVPLHPELIRLGFLQHVAAAAPHAGDPLFPDLEPQGPDGKRGPRATRWFVNYRRAVGVYREGVGMHAFRHSANTRLRDAMTTEQHKRHIDYMLGHSAAGGGEGAARYDKGPGLKAAAETLALLQYPELDLSHLYVSV